MGVIVCVTMALCHFVAEVAVFAPEQSPGNKACWVRPRKVANWCLAAPQATCTSPSLHLYCFCTGPVLALYWPFTTLCCPCAMAYPGYVLVEQGLRNQDCGW